MKILRELEISGKRVLVRADFNVSLDKEGHILDDFRIRATLPTIKYLLENNAKVILMSHLGRPEGKISPQYSLKPVAEKLKEFLGKEILFAPDCIGQEAKSMALGLGSDQILLLENLRFHKEEEENNSDFAKKLAELGEIYINDAFGVSHRAHASVEAITKILPSAAGLLLEKEIENLARARNNPEHPFLVIIGGAKISTKIKLIRSFLNKAEDIILGGALANTVLWAKGIAIGSSFIEEKMKPEVENLEITNTKIHLPVDALVSENKEGSQSHLGPIGKTGEKELILDIGPDSEKLFSGVISNAKTIIWNGAMGYFENEAFAHGTIAIAKAIAGSSAYSIVGGGETIELLEKEGIIDSFSFASTGGGAMMEFLAGDELPGIAALKK